MADNENLPATQQGGVPSSQIVNPGSPIGDRAIKQLWLIIILAAAIAGGMFLYQWAKEPVYKTLFADLSGSDATQVLDALSKSGIAHKVDSSTGAIMVQSDKLYEARIKLAGDGLPSGSGRGFEILDKEQGFGTSQFIESARYNHALESELGRSITQIKSIESARVHLAIAKQSAFLRNSKKSTASVVVNLHPGRSLIDNQVASIVHLVASSVPNLDFKDVSVIDQYGRLLTEADQNNELGQSAKQLDYKNKIESTLISRIESILTPIVGIGGVKASVHADVDFSYSESTSEKFDDDGKAVISEQISEESLNGKGAAQGVPGALSNQAPVAGVEGGAAGGADSKRKMNSVKNYEVGKTISHQKKLAGKITQLTVAVVVDNIAPAGGGDKQALTPEQMNQITALIKEAVGHSEDRGDRLSVMNAAFQKPATPVAEEPGLMEQAWVFEAAKIGAFALLGILLLVMVVKPTVKALIPKIEPKVVQQAPAASAQSSQPVQPPSQIQVETTQFDADVDKAREIANEDPALAANIVKTWMQG
ncbi:MAG: flagellar M-ring protein FliF [Gammaproteobacteria bacterium]|nr:MAG: flagellar M-ring protein FliF [Gammaproteobacteria bacterium]